MSDCVVINLAAAQDRRASVEASFAAADHRGWTLRRFEALGPAEVQHIPGRLSPNEKGCFASHRAALGAHLDDEALLMVVEDDAVFSRDAFGVAQALLDQGPEWDVIFTDVALFDFSLMVQLAKRRDAMAARGEYLTLDLAGRSFAGSTAYVVRGSAKRRLHAALAEAAALDLPYDLYLRDLCAAGRFRMGVAFPFVTSLSPFSDTSQIQDAEAAVFDRTIGAFRRLMFVARDLEACRRETAELRAAYGDESSEMVGAVFAAIVSPAFPIDR